MDSARERAPAHELHRLGTLLGELDERLHHFLVQMLAGFWLRPDLELEQLSVFTWPGYTAGRELYDEVMQSLVELAEERPDAVQLMRGRTFARAVH